MRLVIRYSVDVLVSGTRNTLLKEVEGVSNSQVLLNAGGQWMCLTVLHFMW